MNDVRRRIAQEAFATFFDSLNDASPQHVPMLQNLELCLISEALKETGGNVSKAARILGLGRGALRYRMESAQ
jgi:DNA-binding protein Fis